MKPIYFVSDLHLAAERPELAGTFMRFLQNEVVDAQALYILGDLFEYWIGDDDPTDIVADGVLKAIAAASARGVAIEFVAGNRDLIIGAREAARYRFRLLPEQSTISLFGRRAVISHGDEMCIDDVDYQRFRRGVRNRWLVAMFRTLPLAARRAIAHSMHRRSKAEKQAKPAEIMDVNAGAVAETFRRYGVDLMIHGHTHRPAVHALNIDGRACTRIVLADWYTRASCLRVIGDRIDSVVLN